MYEDASEEENEEFDGDTGEAFSEVSIIFSKSTELFQPRILRFRRRRRRGGALKDILSSAHRFIKDNRLISKGLRHLGHPKLAAASHSLGYGRRRLLRSRRRRYGGYGGNYFTTSQIAVPRF